jgi:hypothetical protein
MFLLSGLGAAAQNHGELPVPTGGPEESLNLEGLLPGDLLPEPTFAPLRIPQSGGPKLFTPFEPFVPTTLPRMDFAMPTVADRTLFIQQNLLLQQRGIVVPAASSTSSRMLRGAVGGYMPLMQRHNGALGLTGSSQLYPSMGFSSSLSLGYAWAPTDGITLYGNAFVTDNMHHLSRFRDFGVSGRVRMQVVEDRVWLNGYGTYSLRSGVAAQQLPPGLYPTTSFGGTVEVKITDSFGIEGGVMREYDPFTRSWRTTPYASPVFY